MEQLAHKNHQYWRQGKKNHAGKQDVVTTYKKKKKKSLLIGSYIRDWLPHWSFHINERNPVKASEKGKATPSPASPDEVLVKHIVFSQQEQQL